jgi:predicted dehydrogenase/threonine dehydrogenase-like Zn-dependent dehydrogenase
MKQILIRQGQVLIEEVPAPMVEPGTVLVQVDHSCISVGTEMSGIRSSSTPLWKKAMRQPEKVKKAIQMVQDHGLLKTHALIKDKVETANPTGYSAAGTVLAVGEGVDDIRPGDRVACAGAQCAFHAEVICTPRNLTVPIPDNIDFAQASTVTLGAIALQGVRRAEPTLGETFVVVGLGILGQLTCQLLQANGCRVIGCDIDQSRIDLALSLGMHAGVHPEAGSDIDQIVRLTDGYGADGVIITAASPSDGLISSAFRMCRKKGRVVLVGDVGLNLNRADFYEKELDFRISCSYGPGRYDRLYEEKGLDYPIGYVRWTENRNMHEYLRLVAEKRVQLEPLIHSKFTLDQAQNAYASLNQASKPLMVLLTYPKSGSFDLQKNRYVLTPNTDKNTNRNVKLAVVGAGMFAKNMHLPHVAELSNLYHLQAVMSRTGHNATLVAQKYQANYSTTDYDRVIKDPEVDAILIATRHNLHASMALQALRAGKHVLLEKPLALTPSELKEIEAFYSENKNAPILLTGFNRRFSPFAQRMQEQLKNRVSPLVINYRMNAGHMPATHWVHGPEGGGRNIGEACHIYDLFVFLTNSRVKTFHAQAIKSNTGHYKSSDNFIATFSFEDGSIATLTYTALGSTEYPKEHMEIFADGRVLVMEDFKKLEIFGSKSATLETRTIQKGQKEELIAFAQAISQGSPWPIPLWQQVEATQMSFETERFLVSKENAT